MKHITEVALVRMPNGCRCGELVATKSGYIVLAMQTVGRDQDAVVKMYGAIHNVPKKAGAIKTADRLVVDGGKVRKAREGEKTNALAGKPATRLARSCVVLLMAELQ